MEKLPRTVAAKGIPLLCQVVFLALSLVELGFFLLVDDPNDGLVGSLVESTRNALSLGLDVCLDNGNPLRRLLPATSAGTAPGSCLGDPDSNPVPAVSVGATLVLLDVLLHHHLLLEGSFEQEGYHLAVEVDPLLCRWWSCFNGLNTIGGNGGGFVGSVVVDVVGGGSGGGGGGGCFLLRRSRADRGKVVVGWHGEIVVVVGVVGVVVVHGSKKRRRNLW